MRLGCLHRALFVKHDLPTSRVFGVQWVNVEVNVIVALFRLVSTIFVKRLEMLSNSPWMIIHWDALGTCINQTLGVPNIVGKGCKLTILYVSLATRLKFQWWTQAMQNIGWSFSPLNDEQMSNHVRVEPQPADRNLVLLPKYGLCFRLRWSIWVPEFETYPPKTWLINNDYRRSQGLKILKYWAPRKTTTVRKLLPETWGFLCPVPWRQKARCFGGVCQDAESFFYKKSKNCGF